MVGLACSEPYRRVQTERQCRGEHSTLVEGGSWRRGSSALWPPLSQGRGEPLLSHIPCAVGRHEHPPVVSSQGNPHSSLRGAPTSGHRAEELAYTGGALLKAAGFFLPSRWPLLSTMGWVRPSAALHEGLVAGEVLEACTFLGACDWGAVAKRGSKGHWECGLAVMLAFLPSGTSQLPSRCGLYAASN